VAHEREVVGDVPIASMVTMQPSMSSTLSSSGIAVISLDFSAVAVWPSTTPALAAKALTRWNGAAAALLIVRRLELPSMAMTGSFPSAGMMRPTQVRNACSN
jgi:hypothetical protein